MLDLLRRREAPPARRKIGYRRHVWEGDNTAVVETDALFARSLQARACHRLGYGEEDWRGASGNRRARAGFSGFNPLFRGAFLTAV